MESRGREGESEGGGGERGREGENKEGKEYTRMLTFISWVNNVWNLSLFGYNQGTAIKELSLEIQSIL